jgi:hypothetical protein
MHNFATIITTAAVGAYLLDSYPEAAGECAAFINFARTLGGFIVGYVSSSALFAMNVADIFFTDTSRSTGPRQRGRRPNMVSRVGLWGPPSSLLYSSNSSAAG